MTALCALSLHWYKGRGKIPRAKRGIHTKAARSARVKVIVNVIVLASTSTFRENGNKGTDHGHGSVYWILGGSINGGRIAGEQTKVERASLFQDRDYPVLNEYRAVLGGLFTSLWGLSLDQVQRVFPAATPVDLKLA